MGTILYFDPFNGASGDMILGALLDLGLPMEHLEGELTKLGLHDLRSLKARRVERNGLFAIDLHVETGSEHHHHHPDEGEEHSHAHRGFTEICAAIEAAPLDPWIQRLSIEIFRRLGQAEAFVHGASLETVHFHEVGAVDSIVDIVGACIGFRYFEVEQFYTAPICLGHGTVTFSHGTWPVPAPATVELIKGLEVYPGPQAGEMTTPTGAAILAEFARPVSQAPRCRIRKSGFGAGDREYQDIPNVLRLTLADPSRDTDSVDAPSDALRETVTLLEACVDDMEPRLCGHFLERAFEEGALDVYYTPVLMKKNRPGQLISVLCKEGDGQRFCRLILEETTTLGVRLHTLPRIVLPREIRRLETSLGPVSVKVARLEGRIVNAVPEYDDLRRLSREKGLPLKLLQRKVQAQIDQLLNDDD